jgi:hypothetical protein
MHSPSRKRRSFDERAYHSRNIRVARADNVADFVEFFKENFTYGEQYFTSFIQDLSTPVFSLGGYPYSERNSPPSFVINIMKEFFDLLKNTPELPQIVGPFRDIINIYGKPSHETFSREVYIQECNKIIDKFISDKKLNAELATSIKLFFSNVVSILIDFMYTRNLQDIPEARIVVKVRMDSICSILGELIHIIAKTRPYHKIIQGFTIDDLIKYGKAERDTDIKELKIKNKKTYMDEFAIVQGLNELAEERQEHRDERRRQRKHAGKEGGRRLKMRSIKRRVCKNRSYKRS